MRSLLRTLPKRSPARDSAFALPLLMRAQATPSRTNTRPPVVDHRHLGDLELAALSCVVQASGSIVVASLWGGSEQESFQKVLDAAAK